MLRYIACKIKTNDANLTHLSAELPHAYRFQNEAAIELNLKR